MSKEDFDLWCNNNLKDMEILLKRKYPKCKDSVDNDISDFYEHIVTKHLGKLEDPKGYLYQFVYNRHYRYHSKPPLVISVAEVPEIIHDVTYDEPSINPLDIIPDIISGLALDEQVLYKLHYEEGLSGRAIGRKLGISYGGVNNQIKEMKIKITNKLSWLLK